MSLKARESLANLGGDLRGQQIDLRSDGRLANQSGLIAGDRINLAAKGDITLDTAKDRLNGDASFQDIIGRIGKIDASNRPPNPPANSTARATAAVATPMAMMSPSRTPMSKRATN
ncbi:hypothetical protein ABWL39_18720 [Chitinivorax sp. PXF-14]|uniref:hypothetical protein n=1 Tax=Chitinivorax sp. PXF-14 TaxID=3230488 RepID=UPI003465D728